MYANPYNTCRASNTPSGLSKIDNWVNVLSNLDNILTGHDMPSDETTLLQSRTSWDDYVDLELIDDMPKLAEILIMCQYLVASLRTARSVL